MTRCFIGKRIPFLVCLVLLPACSLHPQADDTTGISSAEIVKKIRCEARQGILEYALLPEARSQLDQKAQIRGIGINDLSIYELDDVAAEFAPALRSRIIKAIYRREAENRTRMSKGPAEDRYTKDSAELEKLKKKEDPPQTGIIIPGLRGADPKVATDPATPAAPAPPVAPATPAPPATPGAPGGARGGDTQEQNGDGKRDAGESKLNPRDQARKVELEKSLPGSKLRSEREQLQRKNFALKMLDTTPVAALLRDNFVLSAIGYDFRFTVSEDNNGSGGATFTMPFSNGAFTLSLAGGENKQRKAERSFDVAEFFFEVLADHELVGCNNDANWRYPIAGSVGLRDVAKTYAELSVLGRRLYRSPPGAGGGGGRRSGGGQESAGDRSTGRTSTSQMDRDQTSGAAGNTAEFTEVLTYTTTITGSVNPRVRLDPVINKFRLTDASILVSGERRDEHRLTVGFTSVYVDAEIPEDQVGVRLQSAPLVPEAGPVIDPRDRVRLLLRSKRTEDLLQTLEGLR
jgi:hypothetical protein